MAMLECPIVSHIETSVRITGLNASDYSHIGTPAIVSYICVFLNALMKLKCSLLLRDLASLNT